MEPYEQRWEECRFENLFANDESDVSKPYVATQAEFIGRPTGGFIKSTDWAHIMHADESRFDMPISRLKSSILSALTIFLLPAFCGSDLPRPAASSPIEFSSAPSSQSD